MLTAGVTTAGWNGLKSYCRGATAGFTAAEALARFSLLREVLDMIIWLHMGPKDELNLLLNCCIWGTMYCDTVLSSRAVWMIICTAPEGS